MMNESSTNLQFQADLLGCCPESVALLERAVRLADERQNLHEGFVARLALAKHATFAGYPDQLLVAMLWCLSQYERQPETFKSQTHGFLWALKWVLSVVGHYPQFSLQQIDEIYQRMFALWQRVGYDPRPLHNLYFAFAFNNGKPELAEAHFKLWQQGTRDTLANCLACERHDEVQYYAARGDNEQAVQVAKPIIQGKLSCAEEPHRTLADVLKPLVILDRMQEALDCQKRGAAKLRSNRSLLRYTGLHLEFLAHCDGLVKGTRMLERNLPGAADTTSPERTFHFYLGAMVLCERLCLKRKTVKLKVPQKLPFFSADGVYQTEVLLQWFTTEVTRLGLLFDARNGNEYYSRDLVAYARY